MDKAEVERYDAKEAEKSKVYRSLEGKFREKFPAYNIIPGWVGEKNSFLKVLDNFKIDIDCSDPSNPKCEDVKSLIKNHYIKDQGYEEVSSYGGQMKLKKGKKEIVVDFVLSEETSVIAHEAT